MTTINNEGADWWQAEELLLREQWEAEQELLKADPAYEEWLQQLESQHGNGSTR